MEKSKTTQLTVFAFAKKFRSLDNTRLKTNELFSFQRFWIFEVQAHVEFTA